MLSIKQWLLLGTHLAAGILGWCLHVGMVYEPHLAKDQYNASRAQEAAHRIEAAGVKLAQAARDDHDTKQETIRYVTRETIKAIPLYIPQGVGVGGSGNSEVAPANGDPASPGGGGGGSLPIGFGRLYDYTTLGIDPPVPTPSGEPLGDPSGISLSALAETHAANSGVCLADHQEVKTWREWYREQEAVWRASTTK